MISSTHFASIVLPSVYYASPAPFLSYERV